ncbi:MAG: hypothetical protein COV96_01170 [Candidatus Zambryskibacteria bacterium CG11_big_fil_rev_8_21_14_0_20_42_18]|uniref:HTH arsR-type domain-containing protein n=1 Tax=Candidatus Zambryskibacteria bacterium CG_4_9_14_3_um_filter_42_15 TaxID=1975112 RepID=A0A2M7WSX8_9BACT|nr:MAG: hypothetical protein COV96_01170 [Candidatus Zambryskibacteria bacterium CG11_big_fil_rev_8_21_14_0_20_42_18]PJA33105.1 MAG: hypothetical protein CO185_00465 [Candidatus Zambryskibacteria bacterium CG_4_9_14_3_um_filter_42_15]
MIMSSYKKISNPTATGELVAMKILSNANRYAIMKLILNAKNDYCVHELSRTMGISQSATSHQLAYLEARGVVQSTRTGKTKCYLPTTSPLARKLARVIQSLK